MLEMMMAGAINHSIVPRSPCIKDKLGIKRKVVAQLATIIIGRFLAITSCFSADTLFLMKWEVTVRVKARKDATYINISIISINSPISKTVILRILRRADIMNQFRERLQARRLQAGEVLQWLQLCHCQSLV